MCQNGVVRVKPKWAIINYAQETCVRFTQCVVFIALRFTQAISVSLFVPAHFSNTYDGDYLFGVV